MLLVLLATASGCGLFSDDSGPRTEQYTTVGDLPLELDVYLPELADGALAPVLVMVHDGGWREGSRSDWQPIAEQARDAGWAVVVPDYRLSGQAAETWPGAVLDVQRALAWIVDNATDLAVDPSRVALLGGSAGGQLVGILASVGAQGDPTTATEPTGEPAIRAVATWSGPFDLAGLASIDGSEPPACGESLLCTRFWQVFPVVTEYLGCAPQACPEVYRAASPLQRVTPRTVPMLVVNGTDEPVPVAQARAMDAALEAAGVRHELIEVPGSNHSRGYEAEVLTETLQFLQAEVDRDSP